MRGSYNAGVDLGLRGYLAGAAVLSPSLVLLISQDIIRV